MARFVQAATVAAAVGVAGTAGAYRTAGELPEYTGTERVRWRTGVVHHQLQREVPPNLTPEDVLIALEQAFGAWSAPQCSTFEAVSDGANDAHAAPGDGVNTIEFVQSGWTSRGYDPAAGGVTDTQYARVGDGPWEIVEADIYINADGVSLSLGAGDAGATRDLLGVLTHEAGHVVGLLHPCEIGGIRGAPECDANAGFHEATMYPAYQAGDETLAQDDVDGACFLYASSTLGECDGGVCGPRPCDGAPDGGACLGPAEQEPVTGKACLIDSTCADNERCWREHCTPLRGGAGDPCKANADCDTGVCTGGFCARECASDDGCASTQSCDLSRGGICEGKGQGFGSVCTDSSVCIGGECLAGAAETPTCTRVCGDHVAPCPDGSHCESVMSENVCVPDRPPPEESGCIISVRGTGKPAFADATGAVAILCLTLARISARRRTMTKKENSNA